MTKKKAKVKATTPLFGDSMEYVEDPEWLYITTSETNEGDVECAEAQLLLADELPNNAVPVYELINLNFVETGVAVPVFYEDSEQGVADQIINFGDAGAYHTGYAFTNRYTELPSGSSGWTFTGAAGAEKERIAIPPGENVDNFTDFTLEFLVYLNGPSESNAGRLFSKDQRSSYGGKRFELIIDDVNRRLILTRGCVFKDDNDTWEAPVSSLTYKNWYYIQVVWASGIMAGTMPTIYQNNESLPLKHTSIGTSAWIDDSQSPIILGNTSEGGYNINGTIAVFRAYRTANTPNVCTSNYLADSWRLNDPRVGMIATMDAQLPSTPNAKFSSNNYFGSDIVQSGTIPSTWRYPVMRIGKNLSSLSVNFDYSSVITRLYPRGTGAVPTELTLVNPEWWPPNAEMPPSWNDSKYVYFGFGVTRPYATFNHATKDGDPLPSGILINNVPNTPLVYADPVGGYETAKSMDNRRRLPSDPRGINRYTGVTLRFGTPHQISSMLVLMRRVRPTTTSDSSVYDRYKNTKQGSYQKFMLGVYQTRPAWTSVNEDNTKNYMSVPTYGPIVWCVKDLNSIPEEWTWVNFPLQSHPFQPDIYAFIFSLWPANTTWFGEYLDFAGSTYIQSPDPSSPYKWIGNTNYAMVAGTSIAGCTGTFYNPPHLPADQGVYLPGFAIQLSVAGPDLSAKFKQAGTPAGHYIKMPLSEYNPREKYYIHAMHAPYLESYAGYNYYGKIEGTMKNEALTSLQALVNAACNYFPHVIEPILTWKVNAIDLYDIDPQTNWAEELTLGAPVIVQDESLGINQKCIISKISKPLNEPHNISLQLDNVSTGADKLLSKINSAQVTKPKYQQGQTVNSPYNASRNASASEPAVIKFEINETAMVVPSIKLTIVPNGAQILDDAGAVTNLALAGQSYFIKVDGKWITKEPLG